MSINLIGALPAGPDMVNLGVNDASAMWPLSVKFNDIYGNSYMYVKFGYAATQGDAVTCAQASQAQGLWTVIAPTTATLHLFAGIAMNTVSSGNYGFIQIVGWNQVALASTSLATADYSVVQNGSTALTNGSAISGNPPNYLPGYGFCNTAASSDAPAVGTVFVSGFLATTAL